jgi:gamma-glutamyltranspeptidase/glutathione hydrolase
MSRRGGRLAGRIRPVNPWLIAMASLPLCLGLAVAAEAASTPALESQSGMVVSAQHLASDVGAAVLRQGGNAIDAAVAMGYALAVTHPCCGNLGGGGFMTIHLADGRNTVLNFREKAPAAATSAMFLDDKGVPIAGKSLDGYLAVGVPGTVLGLETARERYGTLPRARLLQPAIRLAADGFVLTRGDADVLAGATAAFSGQANVAPVFLKRGAALEPGDRLTQPDLAATLQSISDGGADAFYLGAIARTVAVESRRHGGLLTAADFANYTVIESPPVSCAYRGFTVVSAPPPSSGGVTLCEMLRILEGYSLHAMGYHSSRAIHFMTEAMRHAYWDRNRYLGDPLFVDNPVDRLTSDANAAAIRSRISRHRATPSAWLEGEGGATEGATTTHYSVVDRQGNAVSVTYTINDDFGAKVIAGNTGFFLNDEMDDFTAKPGSPNLFGLIQGRANEIAPGKRPLSSMTPTIVLKDGAVVLVVGTPGGSRIITTVLEILVNVIDHGMALQAAVDAPRFHHQWLPDTLAVEPFGWTADTTLMLARMGYRVVPLDVWGAGNAAEIIGVAPADAALARSLGFPRPGMLYGASDPRAPAGSARAPADPEPTPSAAD